MTLFDDLSELARQLLQEYCLRCDEPADTGFCSACRSEFIRIDEPCPRCGEPRQQHRCPATSDRWFIDRMRVRYAFAPPLMDFIRQLKYSGRLGNARALAELIAADLDPIMPDCDTLVAVPLHPTRLRQRTFNQADQIAAVLARRMRKPLLRRGIRRIRNTPPQTELAARERRQNLVDAFRVTMPVTGRRIAIIDDVVTTGATVNALARALRMAGAERVEAWAVARTPVPGANQPARKR